MNQNTTEQRRSVVLCADDFTLNSEISGGIGELLDEGRLSATGCMTVKPSWPTNASILQQINRPFDIGVHLTLTDEESLTRSNDLSPNGLFPRFSKLMHASLLGKLPREPILHEFAAQIDRFEQVMGRTPNFIDGHHHIHQLPIISDVVLELRARNIIGPDVYIRNASILPRNFQRPFINPLRTLAIGIFGLRFRKRILSRNIPTNSGFAGIYDFSDRLPYRSIFRRFLVSAEDGAIIMCHPAKANAAVSKSDPISCARVREFDYFKGTDFVDDLNEQAVELRPFTESRYFLNQSFT